MIDNPSFRMIQGYYSTPTLPASIPASPDGGCLVLPLAFMDANNEDPTCGLLRCLDPYWVDTLDEHPLDRWKKP